MSVTTQMLSECDNHGAATFEVDSVHVVLRANSGSSNIPTCARSSAFISRAIFASIIRCRSIPSPAAAARASPDCVVVATFNNSPRRLER